MSGKEFNIKSITSIFVEGVTDVALYRAILMERFSFSTLDFEEEEDLKEEFLKEKKLSILPINQVRFLKREEELVLIQGKNGYDRLKGFCKEVKNAKKRINRKIREFSPIDIKTFFIFDNDTGVPSECNEELPSFLVVTSQQIPENFIFSILGLLFNLSGQMEGKKREKIERIKEDFHRLKWCFEEVKKRNWNWKNLEKREINLLKSVIGERCHDHLLQELLRLLKKIDAVSEIDYLLPSSIVERFTQRIPQ